MELGPRGVSLLIVPLDLARSSYLQPPLEAGPGVVEPAHPAMPDRRGSKLQKPLLLASRWDGLHVTQGQDETRLYLKPCPCLALPLPYCASLTLSRVSRANTPLSNPRFRLCSSEQPRGRSLHQGEQE